MLHVQEGNVCYMYKRLMYATRLLHSNKITEQSKYSEQQEHT